MIDTPTMDPGLVALLDQALEAYKSNAYAMDAPDGRVYGMPRLCEEVIINPLFGATRPEQAVWLAAGDDPHQLIDIARVTVRSNPITERYLIEWFSGLVDPTDRIGGDWLDECLEKVRDELTRINQSAMSEYDTFPGVPNWNPAEGKNTLLEFSKWVIRVLLVPQFEIMLKRGLNLPGRELQNGCGLYHSRDAQLRAARAAYQPMKRNN